LKFAANIGYTIEPIDGYKFERGVNIFKDYITDLYNEKLECEQNNDWVGRTLYKLQANAFYGRFGMHEADVECELVDRKGFVEIATAYEIKSAAFLGDTWEGAEDPDIKSQIIVEYLKQPDSNLCDSDSRFLTLLDKTDRERRKRHISVGIAAAVTSYAQIHMYQFTSRPDAVYTDTDSVCLQHPLPAEFVNNRLGAMKLEARVIEGMFIKPKIYYIQTAEQLIMRFKGIPINLVRREDYSKLYEGQPLTYKTTRLFKDKLNGITSRDTTITIAPPDDTKRIRVFSRETGSWIDTKPRHWVSPRDGGDRDKKTPPEKLKRGSGGPSDTAVKPSEEPSDEPSESADPKDVKEPNESDFEQAPSEQEINTPLEDDGPCDEHGNKLYRAEHETPIVGAGTNAQGVQDYPNEVMTRERIVEIYGAVIDHYISEVPEQSEDYKDPYD